MILVISGTKEGRMIIKQLCDNNFEIMASTASVYGKSLIKKQNDIQVNDKPFTYESLKNLIKQKYISVVVDASHPFAVNISKLSIEVCCELNVKYIRYERESMSDLYKDNHIIEVNNFEEAAYEARKYDENIFSTVGSNHLETICSIIPIEQLVVRVLPQSKIISKCESFGLKPSNIIAMQGPFSVELNKQLFKQYNAKVIITKDSGEIGGVKQKIEAALALDINIIMILRPKIDYPCKIYNFQQLIEKLN